jgi:hypothetical protein
MIYTYLKGSQEPITFRDFTGMTSAIGAFTDATVTSWDSLTNTWDQQTRSWDQQERRRVLFGDPTAVKIFNLDSGYAFDLITPTSFVERTGLAIIGKDRQGAPKVDYGSRKLISRLWPIIRGNAVVMVRVGAQEELEGPVVWSPPKQFDPVQKYLDFEISGRLNAIRFDSTDNNPWQIEGCLVDVIVVGKL